MGETFMRYAMEISEEMYKKIERDNKAKIQNKNKRRSLLAAAYRGGYDPKVTSAASTVVDVYQILPSTVSFGQTVPDWNYALILEQGTQISYINDPSIQFYIDKK